MKSASTPPSRSCLVKSGSETTAMLTLHSDSSRRTTTAPNVAVDDKNKNAVSTAIATTRTEAAEFVNRNDEEQQEPRRRRSIPSAIFIATACNDFAAKGEEEEEENEHEDVQSLASSFLVEEMPTAAQEVASSNCDMRRDTWTRQNIAIVQNELSCVCNQLTEELGELDF